MRRYLSLCPTSSLGHITLPIRHYASLHQKGHFFLARHLVKLVTWPNPSLGLTDYLDENLSLY